MDNTLAIKNSWILYTTAFVVNFGIGLINFTLMFFVISRFDAGSALVGWMSALWAVAYLLGCLFLNSFRDFLKPRRSIVVASIIMGLSILSIPVLSSLPLVVIAYMIFGAGTSLFWPPLMGWLSRGKEGKSLGHSLALFNLSWSSGVALSPYIAGVIIRQNLTLPIYAAGILYCLVFISFLIITQFVSEFKFRKTTAVKEYIIADDSSPLRVAGWIGVFSAYLFYGTLLFVFPLFATNEWKMTEDKIGLILLLRASISVMGFQISGHSKWWHHNKYQLFISQFILMVLSLILVFNQSPLVLIPVVAIFGLMFAHLYTNSIFHGVSGSINREKRMAIHESFLTIGVVVGSAIGGTIYENSSIKITFLFCSIVIFIALITQVISVRYTKIKTNNNKIKMIV